MWIWIANKFAKFHAKWLHRRENITKSFRGLHFLNTRYTKAGFRIRMAVCWTSWLNTHLTAWHVSNECDNFVFFEIWRRTVVTEGPAGALMTPAIQSVQQARPAIESRLIWCSQFAIGLWNRNGIQFSHSCTRQWVWSKLKVIIVYIKMLVR